MKICWRGDRPGVSISASRPAGSARSRVLGAAARRGAARGALIALALLCTLLPAVSGAARESSDSAAARAYLGATLTFDRAAVRNLPSGDAASAALLARIGQECPNVLADAPGATTQNATHAQFEALKDLQLEFLFTALATQIQPDHSAASTLIATLAHLRWSGVQLAREVHAETRSVEVEFRVPPTDVCGDVRAWATSGYATLPAATRTVLGALAIQAAAPHQRTLEEQLAARGGRPAARELAQIKRLEATLQTAASTVIAEVERVSGTLGFPPLIAAH